MNARAERVRILTLARLAGIGTVALLLGTVARDLVEPDAWPVLGTTGALLALLHGLTLFLPPRDALLRIGTELTLLGDLAVIALVVAVSGSTSSPFAPLLLLEILAVLLTLGRWTAFRAGLLATLAVGWVWTTETGVVPIPGFTAGLTDQPMAPTVVLVALVWATVVLGGGLSSATEREFRRRTEDLTLLHDVTPDLDPRLGPQRIADVLARLLRDRLGYRRAVIWNATPTGYEALAAAGEGLAVQVPEGWDLLAEEEPLPRATASHTVWPIRRDQPRAAALESAFGPEAPLLLAPLQIDGHPVGLLAVEVSRRFGRRPVVRRREIHLLGMLADQAALLLDNARLQRELADQAVTDAVTGLPNHRFLQQRLREELERLSRRAGRGDDRQLSFALFDLDHFKRVNDTYGHPTGDRVLAAVAGAAEHTLRGTDVVCRYGGEEFAAILIDTTAEEAVAACQRLRAAIGNLTVDAHDGRTVPRVTASFGVVTVQGAPPPAEEVVARADVALYQAKDGGRDQVRHADGVTLPAGYPV